LIFDPLIGAYRAEREDVSIRYGLVKPLASYNPLKIAFRQFGRPLPKESGHSSRVAHHDPFALSQSKRSYFVQAEKALRQAQGERKRRSRVAGALTSH
jgi:hypothetical protein